MWHCSLHAQLYMLYMLYMGVNLVGLPTNFMLMGPTHPNDLINIQNLSLRPLKVFFMDFFNQLCVHTRRFTKAEGNNPASKSRGSML